MKSWNDSRSPWGVQLRFEDREFEAMMDEMRYRTASDGFTPGKGVDVELVMIKAIGVEADYTELPPGVLGRSLFDSDGGVRIEVSRTLSDEAEVSAVARRRLRTTLAHECGHVACHRSLFIRDTESLSLFEGSPTNTIADRRILCRSEGIGTVYRGEWWEFQANRCMAALLLPRQMVGNSVKKLLADGGYSTAVECLERGDGERLIADLSREYDVSQTATLYRLQGLGFIPTAPQYQMQLID